MVKTAILVPCYNEELTIGRVIQDFQQVLPHAQIYVYDNNSTDKTAQIAKEAGAIVRHEYKQGKGNVVRSMFRDIDADCYIMVDGDDTYPASFAPEFERLILEGKADMVVGDRLSSSYFKENKRKFHNSGNCLVRDMINFLFHSNLKDIMTGARAFNRAFVKSYPVTCKGFEIETEMTIFALEHNFHIVERPIAYRDRPSGSVSKLNTVSDGIKILSTIGKRFAETKPGICFSAISAAAFTVCAATVRSLRKDELNLKSHLGKAAVAIGCVLVGVVSFWVGIVLSIWYRQKKREFEHTLSLLQKDEMA